MRLALFVDTGASAVLGPPRLSAQTAYPEPAYQE